LQRLKYIENAGIYEIKTGDNGDVPSNFVQKHNKMGLAFYS
jgi:hypothetical protein